MKPGLRLLVQITEAEPHIEQIALWPVDDNIWVVHSANDSTQFFELARARRLVSMGGRDRYPPGVGAVDAYENVVDDADLVITARCECAKDDLLSC